MKRLIGVLFLGFLAFTVYGQKFSVSTNMAAYMNFATLNIEGSFAPHRHWSLTGNVKYNPFTFKFGDSIMQNRQQSYSLGARYWFWHIYSGWWVSGKLQYQEYNVGGIVSKKAEEGDKFGAGLTGGYTYMINSRLNLEFGLGFWSGFKKYVIYDCAKCGIPLDSGTKGFILPNEVLIGIAYVF